MKIYQPHHVHLAQGSLGDSILKISEYVQKAKQYGLRYLTMTDHGSLNAMYAFYNECCKNDIVPIIGIEMYETDNRLEKNSKNRECNHLVLLAKNKEGLNNLFELQNDAAINGFYYKPRTDLSMLSKYGKGIIALSGCLSGTVPDAILNGDIEKALYLIDVYKECFDKFYLEIQPGNFAEQIMVNDSLAELATYTDTPLVATNDIHYLNAEDFWIHNAHVCISRKITLGKNSKLIYPDTCYWFMDRNSMSKTFCYTEHITPEIVEKALDNTIDIAKKCTDLNLSTTVHMPQFMVQLDETEEEVLTKLCFEKLNELLPTVLRPAEYVERLLYELNVIKQLGFCGYFLIVHDFINWAKNNKIAVGPGRGSVAGSLVSYILGISLADPIKYNLIFERFLSPYRSGLPDIDVDFMSSGRDDVMNYVVNKYGFNNCALVSTLHMRKAKGALRDTARVLGIGYDISDKAAKLIPSVVYGDDGEKTIDLSISESITAVKELKEMQKEYPELFEMAIKLEDIPSYSGIHAAGMLISPVTLTDKIPLINSNKKNILATSLSLADAETANFVKFDFLSLATLTVIENTERAVNFKFNYQNEKLFQDTSVWNLISSRNTVGIFQIGSKTYKDRLPKLKPKTIQELAACLALIRGPCISSGSDKIYIEITERKRSIEPIHPLYYNATKDTNGIVLYQEQLMQLAVNFGFSLDDGYRLVKLVAKKKIDEIKAFETKFTAKAKEKNVPENIALKIWKTIVDMGQYSFNRAHALSYALLCYASAYLKFHYPKEFLINLLTNAYERDKKEEIKEILEECRRLGIKFLPLDVNKSQWGFSLENNTIRIGMCAIKSFGNKAAAEILDNRPFASFEEVLDKVAAKQFNKKVINIGIFSGLFDELCEKNRLGLYYYYMKLRGEDPAEEISMGGKEKFSVYSDLANLESVLLSGQFLCHG